MPKWTALLEARNEASRCSRSVAYYLITSLNSLQAPPFRLLSNSSTATWTPFFNGKDVAGDDKGIVLR